MMPFASTAFGNRENSAVSPLTPLGPAQATHDRGDLLGFPPPVHPSRHFALKAPGYGADGVDRFLTCNLLLGLKDGTDYTPFLPAHAASRLRLRPEGTPVKLGKPPWGGILLASFIFA